MSSHDCPRSSDATRAGRNGLQALLAVASGLGFDAFQSGRRPLRALRPCSIPGAVLPGDRSAGELPRHPHGLQHPGGESQPGTDDRSRRGRVQPGIHTIAEHCRQCEHQPDRRDPRGPFDAQGQWGPRLLLLNPRTTPARDAPGQSEQTEMLAATGPASSVGETRFTRRGTSRRGTILCVQSTGQFPRVNSSAPSSRNFSQSRTRQIINDLLNFSARPLRPRGGCPRTPADETVRFRTPGRFDD